MFQPALIDGLAPPRHDLDFYVTPAYQVQALVRRLTLPREDPIVFEPCCGDGSIVRALPESWLTITNDLVPREPMLPDFLLDACEPESWRLFRLRYDFDAIVTNVPFNVAFQIAQIAVTHAPIVAILVRLSWLEPTWERSSWLAEHAPKRLIVLPRHDYKNNGHTDSVTSAWCLWGDGVAPGVDVVSLAERDALLAAEKGR